MTYPRKSRRLGHSQVIQGTWLEQRRLILEVTYPTELLCGINFLLAGEISGIHIHTRHPVSFLWLVILVEQKSGRLREQYAGSGIGLIISDLLRLTPKMAHLLQERHD